MKKETIVTAIVFLGVGFLAGYSYNAHRAAETDSATSATDATPGSTSTMPARETGSELPGDRSGGLPPGHPPVDNPAMIQALKDQSSQNPSDPAPPLRLANLYYDQRQCQQAIEWYRKAVELDPKNVSAHTDLGTCYFNLGRPDEALSEFHRSLQIDPRHEPTWFNLVVVNLEGKHDLAAARKAWEQLHQLNPAYPHLDKLKEALDRDRSP